MGSRESDTEETMTEQNETLTDEQQAALTEMREQAETERAESPGAEVIQHPSSTGTVGAVAVRPDQAWWEPRQLAALRALGLDGVPQEDLQAFLHVCQKSGLDPISREIYLIGRWDKDAPNNTRYTVQTGIDGYRHIAERTGEYAGKEGPWWCGPNGNWTDVWLEDEPPKAARVTVYRRDSGERVPFTATVTYREFVAMYKDRRTNEMKPMPMWQKMPSHMLAKCAEALALRKGFPRQLAGLYAQEEMAQADRPMTTRPTQEEPQTVLDATTGELVPIAPDGFDAWWLDMVACADNGKAALEAAWIASNRTFKEHTMNQKRAEWAALKVKAGAK